MLIIFPIDTHSRSQMFKTEQNEELERDKSSTIEYQKLLKDRHEQLKEQNKDEKSLDVSSLLERRNFIKTIGTHYNIFDVVILKIS